MIIVSFLGVFLYLHVAIEKMFTVKDIIET